MELLDVTSELRPEWDAFVAAHPRASHGHLSAQFELAAATPGVQNVSLAVRDGRALAGVLPLFASSHRQLKAVPVRELTSGAFFPAAPLVSPKLQGKAETRVLDLLHEGMAARAAALRADRVIVTHPHVVDGQPSIVRFGYSPLLHRGFSARHGVGLLVDLSKSAEQLASDLRSGCRQSLAKAEAAGVTVRAIIERAEWMACHELNLQTLGALAYTEGQMAVIWDAFIAPGHAAAHLASVNGTPVAATVTIYGNGSAYYWIGLNRRPAPIVGAGHLTLWTALLAARDRGTPYFELGSLDFGNPKNAGISQFKQSFGGVPYQIVSAQLDVTPVKSAALALGEALVAAAREYRRQHAPRPAAARPPTRGTAPAGERQTPAADRRSPPADPLPASERPARV